MQKHKMILGIDLGDEYSQVACLDSEGQPISLTAITGSNHFSIPTVVSKNKEYSQWFFGEAALKSDEAYQFHHLISKAVSGETIYLDGHEYQYVDLLTLFLQKLIFLGIQKGFDKARDCLVITVELPEKDQNIIRKCILNANIPAENGLVCSYDEAFGHYLMHEKEEVIRHRILLFQFMENKMVIREALVSQGISPKSLLVSSEKVPELSLFLADMYDRTEEEKSLKLDLFFEQIIQPYFKNRQVSSVYLVGDGFQGEWMKNSLNLIARNRKAFQGNNLYVKGACYAGAYKNGSDQNYLLWNENLTSVQFSLRLKNQDLYEDKVILQAGLRAEDAKTELSLIFEREDNCTIQLKSLKGKKLPDVSLPLPDVLERKDRTSRWKLSIYAIDVSTFMMTLKEEGFGGVNKSFFFVL